MSLLAFLGLRHRVRMLPIPLFQVAWTVHWIAVIAILRLVADDMNAASREVLFNCSLVVIIAVVPWDTSGGAGSGRPGTRGINERTAALQPLRRPVPVPTT
jgi:hypothetical protein